MEKKQGVLRSKIGNENHLRVFLNIQIYSVANIML